MRYYTYIHSKADTKEVFYVGKGSVARGRANSPLNRSRHWHNVVAKHGIVVDIAARWDDEEAAYQHEALLIACLRDLGAPLVNLTEGGDGVRGHKHSDEFRAWQAERVAAQFRSDPTFRAKHQASQLKRFSDPEARRQQGERISAGWTDAKRALAAERLKARFTSGDHPRQKVSEEMLKEMTTLRLSGLQLKDIAARFGLSNSRAGILIRNRIRSAHPDVKELV